MTECWIASSSMTAKRRARELKGRAPEGKIACHHCDNPRCYRPSHIYWGTKSTNAIDKVNRHGGNKLTWTEVNEIRKLRKEGHKVEPLAWQFGITPAMVSHICTRRAWNHD